MGELVHLSRGWTELLPKLSAPQPSHTRRACAVLWGQGSVCNLWFRNLSTKFSFGEAQWKERHLANNLSSEEGRAEREPLGILRASEGRVWGILTQPLWPPGLDFRAFTPPPSHAACYLGPTRSDAIGGFAASLSRAWATSTFCRSESSRREAWRGFPGALPFQLVSILKPGDN